MSERSVLPRARGFLKENGLSLVMFALFFASVAGHILAGEAVANGDRRDHALAELTLGTYLTSAHFVESLFENWESEFLQMGLFVVLTKFLKQRGSSESKRFDGKDDVDEDPRTAHIAADAPWPVRRGGFVLRAYEHSLSMALFALFAISFVAHAAGGFRQENLERVTHGGVTQSFGAYLVGPKLWFESFQNWQSEFLSVAMLIVLSIFLRERGSPQSKPVAVPHAETGE